MCSLLLSFFFFHYPHCSVSSFALFPLSPFPLSLVCPWCHCFPLYFSLSILPVSVFPFLFSAIIQIPLLACLSSSSSFSLEFFSCIYLPLIIFPTPFLPISSFCYHPHSFLAFHHPLLPLLPSPVLFPYHSHILISIPSFSYPRHSYSCLPSSPSPSLSFLCLSISLHLSLPLQHALTLALSSSRPHIWTGHSHVVCLHRSRGTPSSTSTPLSTGASTLAVMGGYTFPLPPLLPPSSPLQPSSPVWMLQ